jgi:hypothetical protein
VTIKIYGIVCPIAGVIRYIGKTEQSLERRLSNHLSECRKHQLSHKHRWISKCLSLGLLPKIWLLEEVQVGHDWQTREKAWIRRANELGFSLTNQTVGGDGILLTDEDAIARVKTNLAAAMNIVRQTPEFKAAKARGAKQAWAGHRKVFEIAFASADTKAKQSDRKRQSWADPETRDRLMNRWTPEARAKQAAEILSRKEKIKAAMTPEVRAKQAAKLKETWARRKAELQAAKDT